MIALGQLLQSLVTGGIDKVTGLAGELWSAGGVLGTNVVTAVKAFLAG